MATIYELWNGTARVAYFTVDADDHVVLLDDDGVEVMDLQSPSSPLVIAVTSPAAGASPRSVTLQLKDIFGHDVAASAVFGVAICNDADGAANSTNATIAVGTGTLVKTVTTDKDLIVKTTAAGAAAITVTDGTSETTYLVIYPCRRSKALDCSQYATVTVS